jgi:hypothetical protein
MYEAAPMDSLRVELVRKRIFVFEPSENSEATVVLWRVPLPKSMMGCRVAERGKG